MQVYKSIKEVDNGLRTGFFQSKHIFDGPCHVFCQAGPSIRPDPNMDEPPPPT